MFRGYIIAITTERHNLGLVLSGKLFKTIDEVKSQLDNIAKGLPESYNIIRDEIDSDCVGMEVYANGKLFAGYKCFPIYC